MLRSPCQGGVHAGRRESRGFPDFVRVLSRADAWPGALLPPFVLESDRSNVASAFDAFDVTVYNNIVDVG